jgi:hypothetical protein
MRILCQRLTKLFFGGFVVSIAQGFVPALAIFSVAGSRERRRCSCKTDNETGQEF